MSVTTAARSVRLSAGAAFYLQASIVVFFLASSSAPTPLYAVYQDEWGYSPITTTTVFGSYALAVLTALLTVGSLSDHVGRRPVLIAALIVQATTMLLFDTASGVPSLLLARVVQGLATGAALGALGAGMLDLNKARGTIANAVGPITGSAVGAIGSGLLVSYLPAPVHLVYLVLFAIFVVQLAAVLFMEETAHPRPGALASLRVQFGLPAAIRRPFFAAVPVLIAVWSIAGLYGALSPSLVRLMIGHNSFVLGGLGLSMLAASGAVAVFVLRNAQPRELTIVGTVGLFGGVGITLLGLDASAILPFFIGTAIAGAGFGAGFQGAIRSVVPLAAPHERAGVLSLVFVVSYLAMGLPAVLAGVLVVHGGGVLRTAREYGLVVMALAVISFARAVRPHVEKTIADACARVDVLHD